MKVHHVFRTKKFFVVCFLILILLALILGLINWFVIYRGGKTIQIEFFEDEPYDCILVLGAGLRSDGSPSDMLRDRLCGVVELFQRGVSDTVVLSGDCSGEDYDEVAAMQEYCLEAGIPAEAIVCDRIGYSTYESMVNVVKNGGYQKIVVVTQRYHLYRALFIAREMGAEAIGFAADYHTYQGQIMREIREIAARAKDFFMVVFS